MSTPQEIITEHIRRKIKVIKTDTEVFESFVNAERSVRNDYRGRAIFELFQNAVDKAESNVWITLDKNNKTLTVANDGKPVSIYSLSNEIPRSDFHALCSINTSNKEVGKSIGNKGVGFKSIWEFTNKVEIRSHYQDQHWGFFLHYPFTSNKLEDWEDELLAKEICETLNHSHLGANVKAPSFFFPQFKVTSKDSFENKNAATEIVLLDLTNDAMASIEKKLEEFSKQKLLFVSEILIGSATKNEKVELSLSWDNETINKNLYPDSEWIVLRPDLTSVMSEIKDAATKLDYDVKRPYVTFALPKSKEAFEAKSYFHCYLPTEIPTGTHFPIHGEFYLDNSRKHLEITDNLYNQLLLKYSLKWFLDLYSSKNSNIWKLPNPLRFLIPVDRAISEISSIYNETLKSKNKLLEIIQRFLGIFDGRVTEEHCDTISRIIWHYRPKLAFRGREYVYLRDSLHPYLSHFLNNQLKIIPTSLRERNSFCELTETLPFNNSPEEITTAFFYKDDKTVVDVINIDEYLASCGGISTISWTFKPSGFQAELIRADYINKYDNQSIIRSLNGKAKNNSDENLRVSILKAIWQLLSPKNSEYTNCKHLSYTGETNSRVLLPTISGKWTKASLCYLPSEELDTLFSGIEYNQVDLVKVSKIIEEEKIEGKLRQIGVWDCLPLKRSSVGINIAKPELLTISSNELIFKSWFTWSNNLDKTLFNSVKHQLKEIKWIVPHGTNKERASPKETFLVTLPITSLSDKFNYIRERDFSHLEIDFLQKLDVFRIDGCSDPKKLINLAKCVCSGSIISNDAISLYRSICQKLNDILKHDDIELSVIEELPILIEFKNRAIKVDDSRAVFYQPQEERIWRDHFAQFKPSYLVLRDNAAELIKYLPNVIRFKVKESIQIKDNSNSHATELSQWLEREILPIFLCVASHGQLDGLANIDSHTVLQRWQRALLLISAEAYMQLELENTTKFNIELELDQGQALWEAKTSQYKGELKVFIKPADNFPEYLPPLIRWFSTEIFRNRQLTVYFESIVELLASKALNEKLEKWGVTSKDIDDVRMEVLLALPPERHYDLAVSISKYTGLPFTSENWTNRELYKGRGINFKKLESHIPKYIEHLTILDPSQNNEQEFREWANENISWLVDSLGSINNLIDECRSSDSLFEFDFNPNNWIKEHLNLTSDELKLQQERADIALSKEVKTNGTLVNGTSNAPEETELEFQPNKIHSSSSPSGVAAKTIEQHLEEARNKATRGHGAEKQRALVYAKEIVDTFSVEQQQLFFQLCKNEYKRINLPFVDVTPLSGMDWYHILHIGAKVDGVGYDMLAIDQDLLLLVEVKSSSVFLSEKERRRVVEFSSLEFKKKNGHLTWRMWFIENGKTLDITKSITKAVIDHESTHSPASQVIKGEKWKVNFRLL
jgi:hypothetical protein